jgi:murein DD-endopeptidase MepM/ murein hydrolase activator NlpD
MRVNLDVEQAGFVRRHPGIFEGAGGNPLLDPAICQRMVDEVHCRKGVDWSYGGYLEDRRRLWRGSYLSATGAFLHLGVDFNVPQGTRIAAVEESTVVLVDEDGDRNGGWGSRVFLKPAALRRPGGVQIYAHLQNVRVAPGARLMPGTFFAEVGGPPDNGNWFPHLHIQGIRESYFHELLVSRFEELDGYGLPGERTLLRRDFPNPLPRFPEFA